MTKAQATLYGIAVVLWLLSAGYEPVPPPRVSLWRLGAALALLAYALPTIAAAV